MGSPGETIKQLFALMDRIDNGTATPAEAILYLEAGGINLRTKKAIAIIKNDLKKTANAVENLKVAARKAVDEHRELPNLGCPEDCWCWDLDNALAALEGE